MPPSPRPIRIEGDIAYVELTKGRFALIDAADAWLAERWNWFALETKWGTYAGRGAGLHGRKYTILLHRHLIGAPQGVDVDHRSGDGLDCRRANLRLCTPSQNGHNKGPLIRNRLGVKGVSHNGSSFVAQIKVRGVRRYLGSFSTAAEAKEAYDTAAIEAVGEFARSA